MEIGEPSELHRRPRNRPLYGLATARTLTMGSAFQGYLDCHTQRYALKYFGWPLPSRESYYIIGTLSMA